MADAVVNAANTGLMQGGGVCGYIFNDAGAAEMTEACNRIGYCNEGSAVITPGFKLPAKYVIHAVGPRYIDGKKELREINMEFRASYVSGEIDKEEKNGCRYV